MKYSAKPCHYAPKNTTIRGINKNRSGHRSGGGKRVFETQGDLMQHILKLFGIFGQKRSQQEK